MMVLDVASGFLFGFLAGIALTLVGVALVALSNGNGEDGQR